MAEDFFTHKESLKTLKMIAPGTKLRSGLENVLKAKTGGLIVISNNKEVLDIVDGGFFINTEYSPAYLYELAKMDGAIVLSSDAKKILYANAQLIPNYSIPTTETGTRHRTAERVAKQTGSIVISISQRRNIITIYQDNRKYIVEEISSLFTKANQAIQTLEKYKIVLDHYTTNLSALEFKDLVTLYDVAIVIQKMEMVMRITSIIEKYILQLGVEGNLIKMQLEELIGATKADKKLVFRDYKNGDVDFAVFSSSIEQMTSEELIDLSNIIKILGHRSFSENLDKNIKSRGYRILSKIHRLPTGIIENLVSYFDDFSSILASTINQLDDVEGIGEIRARHIKNGLIKMQQLTLIDRHI